MTLRLKHVLQSFFFIAALILVAQLGSVVSAMCVYNQTPDAVVNVDFDCGWFCENTWKTQPGNSYCRPNESGTLYLTDSVSRMGSPSVKVDAHGWIILNKIALDGTSDYDIRACSYNQDGSQNQCTSYTHFTPIF